MTQTVNGVTHAPEDWTATEQQLWEAFRQGEALDLRTGIPERDEAASNEDWGPERTVRAEVIARLLLSGPVAAPGKVASLKLSGAYITGPVDLAGATIDHYVEIHQCRFERKILISEARVGTLRLVGCRIPRLEASRLHTEGDLHLARCTFADGIRITDAKIGTDLLLNQAVLGGDRYGRAMAADGIHVEQDVEAERMTVHGEMSLRSAAIGGRFSLRGSQLHAPEENRNCLDASNITIGGTLYLSGSPDGGWADSDTIYGSGYGVPVPAGTPVTPLRAHGGVRLSDGRFENACLITDAEFHLSPYQELSLRRIQTAELRMTCAVPPTGRVSLSRAKVGNLVDNPTSWPQDGQLTLTGFTYELLRPEHPFSVEDRIEWLERGLRGYHPEPYEQLAAALRRDARDEGAREVQYAKLRRRRHLLPWPERVWDWLQDTTVGYGYRPGRGAVWLLVAWAVGTAFFIGHPAHPLRHDENPTWNPPLFALSKLLPVIDLGQDGWDPDTLGQWVGAVLAVTGFLLASTVVTAATRLLKRG